LLPQDDLMTDGLGGRLKDVDDVFEIFEIAKLAVADEQSLAAAAAATSGDYTAAKSAWQQHAHQWQVLLAEAGGSLISPAGGGLLHRLTGTAAGAVTRPAAAAAAGKGVQLLRREGLSREQLLQELETSMTKAARRLMSSQAHSAA
jgi:ribulose 1,5-bisphosphate carboxylase large subunit-like protein